MAAYKAIPTQFARIHKRFLTPTWSTIGMGIASIGFYVLFTLVSTNLLTALIGSVGLMIAFYYGLTGFACVWVYRRTLFSSVRNAVMRGLVPWSRDHARGHLRVRVVQFASPTGCRTTPATT